MQNLVVVVSIHTYVSEFALLLVSLKKLLKFLGKNAKLKLWVQVIKEIENLITMSNKTWALGLLHDIFKANILRNRIT